jgi:hypothetical protein
LSKIEKRRRRKKKYPGRRTDSTEPKLELRIRFVTKSRSYTTTQISKRAEGGQRQYFGGGHTWARVGQV